MDGSSRRSAADVASGSPCMALYNMQTLGYIKKKENDRSKPSLLSFMNFLCLRQTRMFQWFCSRKKVDKFRNLHSSAIFAELPAVPKSVQAAFGLGGSFASASFLVRVDAAVEKGESFTQD